MNILGLVGREVTLCEAVRLQRAELLARGVLREGSARTFPDSRIEPGGERAHSALEPVILAKETCHPCPGLCYLRR